VCAAKLVAAARRLGHDQRPGPRRRRRHGLLGCRRTSTLLLYAAVRTHSNPSAPAPKHPSKQRTGARKFYMPVPVLQDTRHSRHDTTCPLHARTDASAHTHASTLITEHTHTHTHTHTLTHTLMHLCTLPMSLSSIVSPSSTMSICLIHSPSGPFTLHSPSSLSMTSPSSSCHPVQTAGSGAGGEGGIEREGGQRVPRKGRKVGRFDISASWGRGGRPPPVGAGALGWVALQGAERPLSCSWCGPRRTPSCPA
jgi:hypothetical protein